MRDKFKSLTSDSLTRPMDPINFEELSATATFTPHAMAADSMISPPAAFSVPSMPPAFHHTFGELPPAALVAPTSADAFAAPLSRVDLLSNVTATSEEPPCDSGAFVCALVAAFTWYRSQPLVFATPMVFMIIGTIAGNVLVVTSVCKFRNLKKQVCCTSGTHI